MNTLTQSNYPLNYRTKKRLKRYWQTEICKVFKAIITRYLANSQKHFSINTRIMNTGFHFTCRNGSSKPLSSPHSS